MFDGYANGSGHFTDTRRRYALSAVVVDEVVEQRVHFGFSAAGSASSRLGTALKRADVAHGLMRMAGTARQHAGKRSRRRSPSSPRCTGCRSARSDASTGSRRTSARPGARRAAPCRTPSTPCPARRCRTRRSARGYLAANSSRPQSLIRSASSTIRCGWRSACCHERLAVRRNEVLRVARLAPRIARPRFSLRASPRPSAANARVAAASSCFEAIDVLLLGRRAGVKQVEVVVRSSAARSFHERDAASLDRVGNDDLRTIGHRVERTERPLDRARRRDRRSG